MGGQEQETRSDGRVLGNVVTIMGAAENGRVEGLRSGFLWVTVIILQTYTEGKPI